MGKVFTASPTGSTRCTTPEHAVSWKVETSTSYKIVAPAKQTTDNDSYWGDVFNLVGLLQPLGTECVSSKGLLMQLCEELGTGLRGQGEMIAQRETEESSFLQHDVYRLIRNSEVLANQRIIGTRYLYKVKGYREKLPKARGGQRRKHFCTSGSHPTSACSTFSACTCNLTTENYCNIASFAINPDTRRSTTGYFFIMGGGPVSFGSVTQTLTSQSTAEAELIALS